MVHGIAAAAAPALDGRGQDDPGLTLARRLFVGVEDQRQISLLRRQHRPALRRWFLTKRQRAIHLPVGAVTRPCAPPASGEKGPGIGVRHAFEARAGRSPPRLAKMAPSLPPAQLDDAPAGGAEPFGDLAPPASGVTHGALAIHVHDPEEAAEPATPRATPTLPSSSSASPTMAMKRPPCGAFQWSEM